MHEVYRHRTPITRKIVQQESRHDFLATSEAQTVIILYITVKNVPAYSIIGVATRRHI